MERLGRLRPVSHRQTEWRVIRWEPEDEPEPEDRRLTPATLVVCALAGLLVWGLVVWGVMAVVR
jgi:hypothetical protein